MQTLEPGLVPSQGGVSFDEWGIDGARLCVANARDALERGAEVRVHTTVLEVLRREDGSAYGVRYRDRANRRGRRAHRARSSSTPPARGRRSRRRSPGLAPEAARLRPGKGIHVFLDRRVTNYAIVAKAIDGRQVFLMPWQNMSVLGTTDDDYYGDLDDVLATGDEVRYLFQAVERVFPSIREARAIGTWGGVRPTLWGWGMNEDRLSREHEIVDHAKDGAAGLYSMVGGKLASYRLFSEEMTDVIARELGRGSPCQSHTLALPGGDEAVDPMRLVLEGGIDAVTATRLEYRHGSRSLRILERMQQGPARGGGGVRVRAGHRGRGSLRHRSRAGDQRRGRVAAHAAGPRRLRRHALRGALRPHRRGRDRPEPGARFGHGHALPARGRAPSQRRHRRRSGARGGVGAGVAARRAGRHRGRARARAATDAPETSREGAGAGRLASPALRRPLPRVAPAPPSRVVQAGAGASALYAGSVDGPVLPESRAAERRCWVSSRRRSACASARRRVVATREGVVRPSRGADSALLDLAPLAGKRIGLVDVPRDDWDAPLLVRSFAESAWARATGTRFELVPLELLEKSSSAARRRPSTSPAASSAPSGPPG